MLRQNTRRRLNDEWDGSAGTHSRVIPYMQIEVIPYMQILAMGPVQLTGTQ